eukprot:scaffold65014_cov19-Tisochrysis_lutea.AAC.1
MMVVHTPGESGNCITEATSKSIIASAMLPQRGGGPNDSNGGSSGGDGGGSNGGGGSSEGKGDGGGGQGHPMQLWTYLYAALLGGEHDSTSLLRLAFWHLHTCWPANGKKVEIKSLTWPATLWADQRPALNFQRTEMKDMQKQQITLCIKGGYGWHLFDLEWPPPGKRSRLKYNHYSPTCPDVKNECWAV